MSNQFQFNLHFNNNFPSHQGKVFSSFNLIKMKAISVVLVLALAAIAMAGYHGHGHGHGNGYGHGGHGGYGHGHGGWGWPRHYQGWANVQAHQTPYSYNFGLQESGKGYNKYVYQGADAHHVTPVHYGWGHGHGYHG